MSEMPIRKHGVGEILPEPGDQPKTASANWSEKDAAELAAENEEEDVDQVPFREDLDLSGFIESYEEHLYGSVVHVNVNPEERDDPFQVGRGPAAFSTCMDLMPSPLICWDVLGYYRTLGVGWKATKKELREAFIGLGPDQSVWQLNCLQQLLDPEVRRAYDMTPLGEEFLDDPMIQDAIKRAAKLEAMRRSIGKEIDVTMGEVLDERGYNFDPEADSNRRGVTSLETGLDTDTKVSEGTHTLRGWTWAYYLWRTNHDATHVLAEWQVLLIAALRERGVQPRIAVGFMGKNPRPYAIGEFDGTTIVFLSAVEEPTADLASRAVSALISDPQPVKAIEKAAGP